ncbi:MAG: hypothetical protein RO469_15905 [Thermincola sp.]|nr:hypothetical protein [Thermincola sp.]MDT3704515.1 hypothetical protein [Thermincola sp.]
MFPPFFVSDYSFSPQGTGKLTLTDEMKDAGVKIITADGKQYYDYSEPINTVFETQQ